MAATALQSQNMHLTVAQTALRGLDLQASELSDEYLHPKADHCATWRSCYCVTPGATQPTGCPGFLEVLEACPNISHGVSV
jgi:hypothetical protein